MEKTLIKKNLRLTLIVSIIFFVLGFVFCSITPIFAQSDQAYIKLESANLEFKEAFIAVYNAQVVGANVTSLIGQLNDGADLLSQAENAYLQSDFTAVIIKSEGVILLAQEVNSAAQNAKQFAYASGQSALLLTLGFSIFGGLIFIVVLFLVWTWFKQRFIGNLVPEKSEVQNQ